MIKKVFKKAGDLVFGKGKIRQADLQSQEQKNLMNQYLRDIGAQSTDLFNIAGQYGREGYNPYDAVGGANIYDRMKNFVRDDALAAQNRVKGSAMGRFSQGAQSAINKIRGDSARQMTDLDMSQLMTEAQFGQQGYQNQMDALFRTLGMGGELAMGRTKENIQGQRPGLLQLGMAGLGAYKAYKTGGTG